jgi:hypothetical protein
LIFDTDCFISANLKKDSVSVAPPGFLKTFLQNK